MKSKHTTINLILNAVAVGMAVASIALGFVGAEANTQMSLLGIGLFALAVSALRQQQQPV